MLKFKIIIIIYITLISSINVFAQKHLIKIGAGSLLGSDYTVATELCKFIKSSNKNVRCEVVPAKSSVNNLTLLQQGAIDLSLVHANIAMQAFNGTGYYANSKPMNNISQVLKLHDKTFTVIVRDNEKIKVLADIDGKKISKGSDTSDGYIVYDELSKLYGFQEKPIDISLHHDNYAKEFCTGKVDAMILMAGHPNALVRHIAHHCEINFVHIEDNKIQQFLQQNPEFHKTTLNKGLYSGITENQNTFSVPVLLLTTDKIDPELLTKFTQYFIKNFLKFKKSQNILNNLNNTTITDEFVPFNKIAKKVIDQNNAILSK
jgi:TRAP transporter TAXI family solute receptor